jgi:uncharacterized protein YaaN involved in tellurite resistance
MATALATPNPTDAVLQEEKTLPAGDHERAIDIAKSLDLDPARPETITNLGAQSQQQAAAISQQLLNHVKVKDAGEAGSLLLQLSTKCKAVDVTRLQPSWRSRLSHAPVIGGLFGSVQNLLGGYESTISQLGTIRDQLQTAQRSLLGDVKSLNTLYEQNLTIYRELQVWIEAGKMKLAELDSTDIPQAKAAVTDNDGFTAQKLSDLQAMRERLDKRIHDLELTAMVRLQNAPKIRIIQSGDVQLAEKLQSSVLNTLPLWMDNLALAVTQIRQKEAAELEDKVDDTTNALLKSSADMLHQNTTMIAKQASRGVVDIETLKYSQKQILDTIADTQKIMEAGRASRDVARASLSSMKNELGQTLKQQAIQ